MGESISSPSTGGLGGPATDHGELTGLGGDDHLQYHTDARGDLRYPPISVTDDLDTRVVDVETKTDFLTVTAATDLDAIRTRVLDLDAAVVLRGIWDASAGTFPGGGTAQAGSSYIVSVGGTVDGEEFNIGDRVIALVDNAAVDDASHWYHSDYTDLALAPFIDTAANLAADNDVHALGRFIIADGSSPASYKIGDGVTAFNSLPWFYARTPPDESPVMGAVLAGGSSTTFVDVTLLGTADAVVDSIPWWVEVYLTTFFGNTVGDAFTVQITDSAGTPIDGALLLYTVERASSFQAPVTIKGKISTPGTYNGLKLQYKRNSGTGTLTLNAVTCRAHIRAYPDV